MLRWTIVLLPLLMCGLMCFGGVILAALGIGHAARNRGAAHSPATTQRTGDDHAEV